MVCHTSFLSRQSDVIASFSFGANQCTVENFISARNCVFGNYLLGNRLESYYSEVTTIFYELCLHLARREGVVAMQWLFSTNMPSAHVVGER